MLLLNVVLMVGKEANTGNMRATLIHMRYTAEAQYNATLAHEVRKGWDAPVN